MPSWLIWFLVFGNLVNLAFDTTIIVCKVMKWVKQRRYEKRRGVVRHTRWSMWLAKRREAKRRLQEAIDGAGWP